MGTVLLYGILLAHLNAYKEHYASIGIMFCMTYVFKRMIKSSGSQDYADLTGLGGYVLTVGEVVNLIKDMKRSGFQGDPSQAQQFIGGALGKMISGSGDIIKFLTQSR